LWLVVLTTTIVFVPAQSQPSTAAAAADAARAPTISPAMPKSEEDASGGRQVK
jgi:hypothetical protein